MTMLMNDPKLDRVVRELASRTGETVAEAMTIAAEERLARLPAKPGRLDREKLERTLAQIRSYPRINDHLTDDEIIGYDENGLPS